MKKNFRALFIAVFIAVFSLTLLSRNTNVFALEIPPAPIDVPIVDQTNILTTEQKNTLSDAILAERAKSSNEIGILIVPSLENEAIEEYTLNVARAWGIGTKENKNGVLLFVALNDKKIRIEVNSGLEGSLTDAKSKRIISDVIIPEFKKGNYYKGINDGLTAIIGTINNEYQAPKKTSLFNEPNFWMYAIVMGFFVVTWLGSVLGRSKRWWVGGVIGGVLGVIVGLVWGFFLSGILAILVFSLLGLIFDKQVSKNYAEHKSRKIPPSWWAGGTGFGSGSSGGGSSFGGFSGGGGGFSGGGASGSW